MQIVIDIPDEKYERFGYEYREENLISKHMNDIILDAFCNGTPLPKGHGRIIDESKITKCQQVGLIVKDDNTIRCLKTDAPTVIGADTEGETNE